MKVVDLTPEYEPAFFGCLKDWDKDVARSCHKERWYNKMKHQGLRVKIALYDAGQASGMVQYVPIEHSRAEGHDLYLVQCIWVHGYDEGLGNVQGRGIGQALLQAAEQDAQALGARGMAAWGLAFPHWMPAAWYQKHGYVEVDRREVDVLVWKPFSKVAAAPRWMRPRKAPDVTPGKVTVTAFVNGWCPSACEVSEVARRVAAEFGDRVVLQEIDTSEREVLLEWGIENALFIDGECINAGVTDYPPPGYEDIKERIQRRLEKGGYRL